MDIVTIYQYALQREHAGKRFFEENAARLSHAAAVEAFKNLAAEEQKHIEFLETQLALLQRGEPLNLEMAATLEGTGFFSQRAEKEMLDQTVLEAMVPDLPVLRMAYLIERDFSEFYESAAQKAEGQARDILLMLAAWERSHERLFRYMHDQAFEQYAQMPWGG